MIRRWFGTVAGLGQGLHALSAAQARWELDLSNTILRRRKKYLLLALAPVVLALLWQQTTCAQDLPELVPTLGGSKAFMPSFVNASMFAGSILVGLIAGLITGVIGAGGGYILTPALMSFGVRGIMAVGTDQFHLFAKAIMGTAVHRKMGNVNFGLAAWFVSGSLVGVTVGGSINRAIFNYSPALSDAVISLLYVVVLGTLGSYAIGDWWRLRRASSNGAPGAITPLARRLQAWNARPRIRFDQDMPQGGRSIPIYPVIACGALVGFVAAIMGVGGGFLTFPMFVYGLGVSTFTTVGTDILQIIFTTAYSSIFQYAIYGFVFYTVCIGMLLGSLVGVQIGAMVTTMVTGSQIRAFYALTIFAGFANRLCALPRKLSDLGYLSISREASVIIEHIGTAVFFAIVGGFGLWIIAAFLRHAPGVRAQAAGTPPGRTPWIVDRRKFIRGTVALAGFLVVLVLLLAPLTDRGNALAWADNLFNELAKHSAYYVPQARARAGQFDAEQVNLGIRPRDHADPDQLAHILHANGLPAEILEDQRVRVHGSLAALTDADLAFANDERAFAARYGLCQCQVLYGWVNIFDGLTRRYIQDGDGQAAAFTRLLTTKVLEPAYNFRDINMCRVRDRARPVALLLAAYVALAVWYGLAIWTIFEGLGIRAHSRSAKREA